MKTDVSLGTGLEAGTYVLKLSSNKPLKFYLVMSSYLEEMAPASHEAFAYGEIEKSGYLDQYPIAFKTYTSKDRPTEAPVTEPP